MDEHKNQVRLAVEAALHAGTSGLQAILATTEGADPRLVASIMLELTGAGVGDLDEQLRENQSKTDAARRDTAAAIYSLPAEDPLLSQWWFTLDACHLIAARLARFAISKAGFLGAPSAGIYFQLRFGESVVLDADQAVCDTAQEHGVTTARYYDVVDSPAEDLIGQCGAVVIDAPWYDVQLRRFFARAAALCADGGYIISTYPPRLTRPGVVDDRSRFLKDLEGSGFKLMSLEPQALEYSVPHFELQAFSDVTGFSSHPWRYGDLIVHQKHAGASLAVETWGARCSSERYARDPRRFRVFLDRAKANNALVSPVADIKGFDDNISTRAFDSSTLALWTSRKAGIAVRDTDAVARVLSAWQKKLTQAETARALADGGRYNLPEATELVARLEETLELWAVTELAARRSPEKMADVAQQMRSQWACAATDREHGHRSDGYRLEFQRDRDRVLWSNSLKRLGNKTQVFELESDDNVRQRLTHSIEVMQLAATVSASLGLDRDLVEAGALAHDIGHTPFGHAGEHALNVVLNEICHPLGGFNHYEHGVDVVRYLEDVYAQPAAGGYLGLNLTPEVSECVFKHTFCLGGHTIGQAELYAKSKHKDLFLPGPCHLEGQAVRSADKISYLISDMEDGIRLGVLVHDDLRSIRLFRRTPIDLKPSNDESLLDRFVAQRRALLQVLMEDIIDETARRLASCAGLDDVRASERYTVDHSPTMKADMDEVWQVLQKGKLHRAPQVVRANLRSGKIVGELLILFALVPELVDQGIRHSHLRLAKTRYLKWYCERNGGTDVVTIPERLCRFIAPERLIGLKLASDSAGTGYRIPMHQLITAKDYVASMTDTAAKRHYQAFILG